MDAWQSFLIEITGVIFSRKDDITEDGYVVDKILDKTGWYVHSMALPCAVSSFVCRVSCRMCGMSVRFGDVIRCVTTED